MKGAFTPTTILKIRLFRALYPNREYTFVRSTG